MALTSNQPRTDMIRPGSCVLCLMGIVVLQLIGLIVEEPPRFVKAAIKQKGYTIIII